MGPKETPDLHEEFYQTFNKEGIPNFKKELNIFSKNPKDPEKPLTIETLLNFINFKHDKSLPEGIEGIA